VTRVLAPAPSRTSWPWPCVSATFRAPSTRRHRRRRPVMPDSQVAAPRRPTTETLRGARREDPGHGTRQRRQSGLDAERRPPRSAAPSRRHRGPRRALAARAARPRAQLTRIWRAATWPGLALGSSTRSTPSR
jgi:hypothetical protein